MRFLGVSNIKISHRTTDKIRMAEAIIIEKSKTINCNNSEAIDLPQCYKS